LARTTTRKEEELMNAGEEHSGLGPEDDAPIPYMRRIRDYYQALGYGVPYRWAHYAEVPLSR
jgi:D-proline reductase (dithiol) PrdB